MGCLSLGRILVGVKMPIDKDVIISHGITSLKFSTEQNMYSPFMYNNSITVIVELPKCAFETLINKAEFANKHAARLGTEERLRFQYPAVMKAWTNYTTILEMCKTGDDA